MAFKISRRTISPGYEVDFDWGRATPAGFPKDDGDWVEVLRRPPESWSAAEVSTWAARPLQEGGGQLGSRLAERLWENAIDGHLLLMYGKSSTAEGAGGAGGGGGTGGGGVSGELVRALGLTSAEQQRALSKAVERLITLQDRILYGDVVLPPPRELMEQPPQPPSGAARIGGGGRWAGAGAVRRKGRPGVSQTGREQILMDAKAAAAAATAATGSAAAAAAGVASGKGPTHSSHHRRRNAANDATQPADQRGGGAAGGSRVPGDRDAGAASAAAAAGGGDGGGLPRRARVEAEAVAALRRMAQLVAAHEDVARRLQVLRLEGPGGLARYQQGRRRGADADEAAEDAEAEADEAAAPTAPTAPPLQLSAVEERGRLLRERVSSQAEAVDELSRVPLRRALRRAAEAAEAAASGDAGGGSGSGGEGFEGSGTSRVLRGGWREVNDDGGAGSVGASSNVRQSLSAAGRALLAEADRRDAYDPWVYDDDDEDEVDAVGGGAGGSGGERRRRARAAAASGSGGGGRRGSGPVRVLVGLVGGLRGREPGSHEVHPPRPAPDPWRTADGEAVKRVLTRGSATPVHHTLKSKLAEDAVRHMYGIAPTKHGLTTEQQQERRRRGTRKEAAAAGAAALPFYPPTSLLTNPRAAAHEVELRAQMGLPVTADLLAARTVAAPRTARRVVREKARPPEPDAVVTQAVIQEDGFFSFQSRYGFQIVQPAVGGSGAAAPAAATAIIATQSPARQHSRRSAAPAPGGSPGPRPSSASASPPPRVRFAIPESPFATATAAAASAAQHRPSSAPPPRTATPPQPQLQKPGAGAPGAAAATAGRRDSSAFATAGFIAAIAAVASAPAPTFQPLGQIPIGAFPLDGSWRAGQGKEEWEEEDEVADVRAGWQATSTHGSGPPLDTLPPGRRLAPPEAHVRGLCNDGDLRRAIAARAAAVGAAAAAASSDQAVVAAAPPVWRSTSSSRVRGMVRVGQVLEGCWGDQELQRRLRETLRYLDGRDPAPGHGGGSGAGGGDGGVQRPSSAQRSHRSPHRGSSRRRQRHQWQQEIYAFEDGELVYTGGVDG